MTQCTSLKIDQPSYFSLFYLILFSLLHLCYNINVLKIILYIFKDATFHHYIGKSVYAYVYLYMNPLFMCLHIYMYVY